MDHEYLYSGSVHVNAYHVVLMSDTIRPGLGESAEMIYPELLGQEPKR